jgi:hypothetical protein
VYDCSYTRFRWNFLCRGHWLAMVSGSGSQWGSRKLETRGWDSKRGVSGSKRGLVGRYGCLWLDRVCWWVDTGVLGPIRGVGGCWRVSGARKGVWAGVDAWWWIENGW